VVAVSYYLYGPNTGTAPIEQINITTNTPSYLISDSTGVRQQLNSSGTLIGSMTYDSYGNPCATCTINTPYGYAGSYTDPNGLDYLINRYYDPATAQFLSVDPDVAETGQPYAYTNDNPVNDTDPLGLWGWNPISDVVQAAKDSGHFVATHKVVTGIALGVVGVATGGAGFLAEGVAATILSATAAAAGGAAAYLDTRPCLQGNHAACLGAALGWSSALAAVPSTIGLSLGVSEESLSGAILRGLLPGFAFNLGAGALTTDLIGWLASELSSGRCSTT
jgi:RHS repeat-associated protein